MKQSLAAFILLTSFIAGIPAEAKSSSKKSESCSTTLALLDDALTSTLNQLAAFIQEHHQTDTTSPMAIMTEGSLRQKFLELENLLPTADLRSAAKKYLVEKVRALEELNSRLTKDNLKEQEKSRLIEKEFFNQYTPKISLHSEDAKLVDMTTNADLFQIETPVNSEDAHARLLFLAPPYDDPLELKIRENVGKPEWARYVSGIDAIYVKTDLGIYSLSLKDIGNSKPEFIEPHWILKLDAPTIDLIIDSYQGLHGETRDHGWFKGLFDAADFSEDGNIIVTRLGGFRTVYNVRDKTFLTFLPPREEWTQLTHHFQVTPDGRYISNGSRDETVAVSIVDSSTKEIKNSLYYRTHVTAFSHDSQWILIRDKKRQLRMKRIDGSTRDKILQPEPNRRSKAEFYQTHDRLFFGPGDKRVFANTKTGIGVWDVKTGIFIQDLVVNIDVDRFTFSKDGSILCGFNSKTNSVEIWELKK